MSVFDKHEYHVIDTSNWKKFKISDLFDVVLAKGDIKLDKVPSGNIPLISAVNINNGIVGYISEEGDGISEIFSGNKITINKFGKSYYQENDFYARSHGDVNILVPKFNMNKMIGLFICTIIDKHQNEFSFNNACFSNKVKEMIVILPVISDGSPDWQYMESYMQNLWDKIEITFKKENNNNRIDTSEWKKFKISDLFEIEKGRIESAKKFNPGSIPIVSCSNSNNGIVAYCDTESKWKNKITISANGQPGVAYYHAYDFNATADVDILIEKFEGLNKYIALFLCTIMTKLFTPKYSYTNKLGAAKLKAEEILLPVTSDGTPDWQYMEDFMRDIESRSVLIQAIKERQNV